MQVLYPNARTLSPRDLVLSQATFTLADRFDEIPALAGIPTGDDLVAYVVRFSLVPTGLEQYAAVLIGGATDDASAIATGADLVDLARAARRYGLRSHIDQERSKLPCRRYGRDECRRLDLRELTNRGGSISPAIDYQGDDPVYPNVAKLGTAYLVVRFDRGSRDRRYCLANRTTLEVLVEATSMSKLDDVAKHIADDIAAGRDPLRPTWSRLVEPTAESRAFEASFESHAADRIIEAAEPRGFVVNCAELAEAIADGDQAADDARRFEDLKADPVAADHIRRADEIRLGDVAEDRAETTDQADGVTLGENKVREGLSGLSVYDLFGAGRVTITPAEESNLQNVADLGAGWYVVRLRLPTAPLARYNLVQAPSGWIRATATDAENLDALACLIGSYQAKPGEAITAHQGEILTPATPDELREADRLEAETVEAEAADGRPYYSLAVLYRDDEGKPTAYGIEFGSYDRADVEAEREELDADQVAGSKIIRSKNATAAEIERAVDTINRGLAAGLVE